MNKKILITGGAGFIGSALIRYIINNSNHSVINVDKLTYAGNLETLESVKNNPRYIFEQVDVCNSSEISRVFDMYQPDLVIHLAAETHVDRSIDSPYKFIQTNIFGTYVMLETTRDYWLNLNKAKKNNFKFLHISTDEVYGDLGAKGDPFTEKTPYLPNSPYSATKASSDHLVRAWHRTYKLPTLITNCSNNYGPYQYPEKFIPLVILNALEGKELPIYGDGKQVRDWLYVDDHVKALLCVAFNGKIGENYNIGGHNELQNIEVVKTICFILDKLVPSKFKGIVKYEQLITYVDDRPGHDVRYAIDASKMVNELNWSPGETFTTGIKKTIEWYLKEKNWCNQVKKSNYLGRRLGTIKL